MVEELVLLFWWCQGTPHASQDAFDIAVLSAVMFQYSLPTHSLFNQTVGDNFMIKTILPLKLDEHRFSPNEIVKPRIAAQRRKEIQH
nr:hypothetical protein [Candidatus Njordarchaeum guaymaensis]